MMVLGALLALLYSILIGLWILICWPYAFRSTGGKQWVGAARAIGLVLAPTALIHSTFAAILFKNTRPFTQTAAMMVGIVLVTALYMGTTWCFLAVRPRWREQEFYNFCEGQFADKAEGGDN